MKTAAPMERLVATIMTRIRQTTRVSVIGEVEAYDAATQTCTVRPLVPEQDLFEGESRDLPPPQLKGIPVLHHGGSARGLTMGVEVGDRVLLVVRHRSHQEVDDGAEPPISPQDGRRMALSEVVAIPGYTTANPAPSSDSYRSDGQPVLYMDTGEALHLAVSTASIALARADRVQQQLDDLKTYLDAHTHAYAGLAPTVPGLTTPPSSTPGTGIPPDLSPTPPTVASTRIQVDE